MESNQESSKTPILNPLQPVLELIQGGDPDLICARYGITRAELDKQVQDFQSSRRQMALTENLVIQKVGRNDPCPCKSGKKYKKCCLPKHEEARKNMPPDRLKELEEQAKRNEKIEKDVSNGFDLLFSQDYSKAQKFALHALESNPEDDRLYDIAVSTHLARGEYAEAFLTCRRRWQVAREEKDFFQENGYHKREGLDRKKPVHFYSPSTWLEKFWIAQRARTYQEARPAQVDTRLTGLVEKLKIANDVKRFPGRQDEGYAARRQTLAPVLEEIEKEGVEAIHYLLPLTFTFSWASLFVPDLLLAYGTEESIQLLAELSMFRFPYFSQKCLANLESFGERAVPEIQQVIEENPAFDELKVGLIAVLGNIQTQESFDILAKLTEHENPYVVNWVAQALGRQHNPEALPYLQKAKDRLGAMSKIAGAIRELAMDQGLVGRPSNTTTSG